MELGKVYYMGCVGNPVEPRVLHDGKVQWNILFHQQSMIDI